MKWSDYFYYDETSPTGLRYAKDVVSRTGRVYKRRDDVAGFIKKRDNDDIKCWTVLANNKRYYVHRIVCELNGINLPVKYDVDHIDGDPLNNTVENLRVVPHKINTRNSKKSSANSTGVTGVSFVQRKRLSFPIYVAHYKNAEGKPVTKEFSTFSMSNEEAFRLACEWRERAIKELNAQGAGYTERHGK